jgi:hypothetical protein
VVTRSKADRLSNGVAGSNSESAICFRAEKELLRDNTNLKFHELDFHIKCPLSPRYVASSDYGWRKRPLNMEVRCEYIK